MRVSVMKRRYQREEYTRNRGMILSFLASSPLRYKELKGLSSLSDAVLSKHLKKLMDEKLIRRVIRGEDRRAAYAITSDGLKALKILIRTRKRKLTEELIEIERTLRSLKHN